MKYSIKNVSSLRKLLWLDTLMGGVNGILGICFFNFLAGLMGLSTVLILTVSIITLCYAVVAFVLANQAQISVTLTRILVYANWAWTFISIGLLLKHFNEAELYGKIFLVLQILVVGGLAYLEGRQLKAAP